MDGDLQHPPELIPLLVATGRQMAADVVVASRHVDGGSSGGLSGGVRRLVSHSSTMLTRAMFPKRLRDCTDPMTGFFAVRRSSIDVTALRPRGFKILLEILARQPLTVVEEPFVFAARNAGQSKADFRQGLRFLAQLAALRFGRLSRYALIGAVGALANLLIMAALQGVGVGYLAAAIVSGAATILGNFVLQERFVFQDLREEGRGIRTRLAQSLAFNGTETVLRTALLWLLVESTSVPGLAAQAFLIAVSFVLRFVYHSRIVYRPKRTSLISPLLTTLDAEFDTESSLNSGPRTHR
jgi:dolichol-phosphate mannosyltransferase